jgi:hypothetical protein
MRPFPLRPAHTVRSFGAALLLAVLAAPAPAAEPLHRRIDEALASGKPDFARHAAGPATDAEFLRRVTLDLTGTVPTADEARAFLRDAATDKRARLVDRLLQSPAHARHLAAVLDVMLMERRPAKHVPAAAWREYLREAIAANRPWDALARDILTADGTDPKQRPAARFVLDREAEPNLLTRDVSRLFLGRNLQCAQCHDHPKVEEYRQAHYYGLLAFFSRTAPFPDPALKQTVLAEKAEGEVTFQSVFDPAKVVKHTGPRVLDLKPVAEPAAEKGKEYVVAPAPGKRSVPRWSRRAQLGPQLTRADNPAFARNAANRLWALLMGRGLVHPLDMDHPANPPSHPELLDLLTREFAARGYDVRGFLREICLTDAYQRSSEPPPGDGPPPEPTSYAAALLKPLTPEQLAGALLQATGIADAERRALGAGATDAALAARLDPVAAPVVAAFAGQPGAAQSFDATIDQALFLANGPTVRGWLAPRPGGLTDRLQKLPSADAVADELYLSVLTRPPAPDERKEVVDYLARRPADRAAALAEMAWALLASAEFRFNH